MKKKKVAIVADIIDHWNLVSCASLHHLCDHATGTLRLKILIIATSSTSFTLVSCVLPWPRVVSSMQANQGRLQICRIYTLSPIITSKTHTLIPLSKSRIRIPLHRPRPRTKTHDTVVAMSTMAAMIPKRRGNARSGKESKSEKSSSRRGNETRSESGTNGNRRRTRGDTLDEEGNRPLRTLVVRNGDSSCLLGRRLYDALDRLCILSNRLTPARLSRRNDNLPLLYTSDIMIDILPRDEAPWTQRERVITSATESITRFHNVNYTQVSEPV